jgi:endonuclease/exonuclease/phosphatase family metal-dependent hydrolase
MPTRIGFWNVQRLGASTDQARQQVLNHMMTYWQADLYVLCELTTTSVAPPAQNLTYRAQNASQLCYGAWDSNGQVNLMSITPIATPAYKSAHYKGGNDFTKLADRAVALAGNVGHVAVHAIHAPAGRSSGLKAMAFIAAHMDAAYQGNAWLVFGDFNCLPADLARAPLSIDVGDLVRSSGKTTHVSPKGSESELDFVLCNFPAKVKALRYMRWGLYSDHSPIMVEY